MVRLVQAAELAELATAGLRSRYACADERATVGDAGRRPSYAETVQTLRACPPMMGAALQHPSWAGDGSGVGNVPSTTVNLAVSQSPRLQPATLTPYLLQLRLTQRTAEGVHPARFVRVVPTRGFCIAANKQAAGRGGLTSPWQWLDAVACLACKRGPGTRRAPGHGHENSLEVRQHPGVLEPYRLELVRAQPQNFEDGGSDLLGLHRLGDNVPVEIGM